MLQHSCVRQSVLLPKQQQHRTPVIVCRHDLRKSANNAKERKLKRPKRIEERMMDPSLLLKAKSSIAFQCASSLAGATSGRLSRQLCLFLFTEQPQLMGLNTQVLAGRIAAISDVTGLRQPDATELIMRNAAMLDVLPLRLNSTAEALSVALAIPKQQALAMLAADQNLLDIPALRIRQQLEALSSLLQVPFDLLAQLAVGCPYLLRVDGPAVKIRWSNISALLGLAGPELEQLLLQEPRLLMPSSSAITHNFSAICSELDISPVLLKHWVSAAPLLLLVPAPTLKARLKGLLQVLERQVVTRGIPGVLEKLVVIDGTVSAAANSDTSWMAGAAFSHHQSNGSTPGSGPTVSSVGVAGSRRLALATDDDLDQQQHQQQQARWVPSFGDASQVAAYVTKDPRVLLLNPEELPDRLHVVQQELRCSMELLLLLVCSHPSYLVVEPGFVSCWVHDVRHLTNMSAKQARMLLVSPQVFLTMTPEEVLLSLQALSSMQQLTYPTALHMAVQAPLLLVQHPAATTAAHQQLCKLVTDRYMQKMLLLQLPELLLMGGRLRQALQDAAGALSLSVAQLAMLLTSDASLWYVIHPRGTWGQQQQQQQQQQLPGLASLVAAMSAVTSCGVRPPAVMQQAILQQPGLLQLTPQTVHQQVQRFVGICSRSESWKQQLQALSPQLIGKGIIRAAGWGKYWLFLVATGLSSTIRLHDVLEVQKVEFLKAFHMDYLRWRQMLWEQEQQRRQYPAEQQQQQQGQLMQHQQLEQQQLDIASGSTDQQQKTLQREWLMRTAQASEQQQLAIQQQHQQVNPQQQKPMQRQRQRDEQQQHQQEGAGWDCLVQGMQAISGAAAKSMPAAAASMSSAAYTTTAAAAGGGSASGASPVAFSQLLSTSSRERVVQPAATHHMQQKQQQLNGIQDHGQQPAVGDVFYAVEDRWWRNSQSDASGSGNGSGGVHGRGIAAAGFTGMAGPGLGSGSTDGDGSAGLISQLRSSSSNDSSGSGSNSDGSNPSWKAVQYADWQQPAKLSDEAFVQLALADCDELDEFEEDRPAADDSEVDDLELGSDSSDGGSSAAEATGDTDRKPRAKQVRPRGYGAAIVGSELALIAALWSALEMYGSWNGCLMRPAHDLNMWRGDVV